VQGEDNIKVEKKSQRSRDDDNREDIIKKVKEDKNIKKTIKKDFCTLQTIRNIGRMFFLASEMNDCSHLCRFLAAVYC
jgi:hypothetical protein